MTTRQGNTIDGFNLIAPVYDTGADVVTLGLHRVWKHYFCKTVLKKIPSKGRLLDIGTGTGDLLFRLLQHRHDLSLVGIDLSEGMLAMANQKLKRKSNLVKDNIKFEIANALSLPYPAEKFDVVTLCWTARSVRPLQVALREALRVLKPGGSLCILEHGLPELKLVRPFLNKFNHSLPMIGDKLIRSKIIYPLYTQQGGEYAMGKNFAAGLHEAGFTKVSYKTYAGGLVYIYLATKFNVTKW